MFIVATLSAEGSEVEGLLSVIGRCTGVNDEELSIDVSKAVVTFLI